MAVIKAKCTYQGVTVFLDTRELAASFCEATDTGYVVYECPECGKVSHMRIKGGTLDLLDASGITCRVAELPQPWSADGKSIEYMIGLLDEPPIGIDSSDASAFDELFEESLRKIQATEL